MTTNSKKSYSTLISIKPSDFKEDWNALYKQTSLLGFEYHLFFDALHFLALNNVFFDRNTILDIRRAVMKDIDKKNFGNEIVNIQLNEVVPMKLKDAVLHRIDKDIEGYMEYVDIKVKNPKKMVIQEIDDLYYICIILIRDASMNGKKSTSNKTIDDYYKEFIANIDRYKKGLHNIEEVDVLYSMFEVIRKCKYEGGDFHMIDTLCNKLGEYLEANYKD